MARYETRFGAVSALGTSYTAIATADASSTANLNLNVTCRVAAGAALRAYVAGSAWSSGEPSGAGTVVAAIAYDTVVNPGQVLQFSGIIMNAGEKLVVRADTASSLDVIASGVKVS